MSAADRYDEIIESLLVETDQLSNGRRLNALSRDDMYAVGVRIWELVPKREKGDGVEKFIAPLSFLEVSNDEQKRLIKLWDKVNSFAFKHKPPLPEPFTQYLPTQNPMAEPVNHAIDVLAQVGVDYEGWEQTYLYFDEIGKGLFYVEKSTYDSWFSDREQYLWTGVEEPRLVVHDEAMAAKVWEQFKHDPDTAPKIYIVPETKSDVRNLFRTRNLRHHFSIGNLEQFTPLWHAANILHWYNEVYSEEWRNAILDGFGPQYNRATLADAIQKVAQASMQIGRSYEALLKKPYEPAAITGMKVQSGQKNAADKRRLQTQPQTIAIVNEMEKLIEEGKGVSLAAKIAHQRGYGSSPNANRAAWYRHTEEI